MNRRTLILKTLRYYWRTNLAVMLGVAIGTAVIAGALIVGDSIRASLQQMTLDRLGEVDLALSGGRFFREELASQLQQQGPLIAANEGETAPDSGTAVAPAILLTGTLQYEKPSEPTSDSASDSTPATESAGDDPPTLSVAGRVNLIGCEERLWKQLRGDIEFLPDADSMVLNQRVAEQLGVQVGEEVTLYVNVPTTIPQESLLGERDIDELVVEYPLTVTAIIEEARTLSRFSLMPNQQLPLNAYVNLQRLQEELDLFEQPATPRNPVAKPARVNALLAEQSGVHWRELAAQQSPESLQQLTEQPNQKLAPLWRFEDLHLHIREFPDRNYFVVESDRMVLEKSLSEQTLKTAQQLDETASPLLVYLVNEISNAKQPDKFSMYSVAAGLDFPQQAPLGPFVTPEDQPIAPLQAGEVAINDWLAEDLAVQVGEEIVLKYHVVGSRGNLPELEKRFRVAAIVKLGDTPANDPALTPYVEGITDARTLADWEQPFPMQMSRITDRDDQYWEQYKTTPKVFLNLAEARELWQSRYGDTTSVRIPVTEPAQMSERVAAFRSAFLKDLPTHQLGLTMLPVKVQGLQAAQGTQDFTGLFIGFSFFVIAAATVLIALLFRLGIEARVRQMGLYAAVGLPNRTIRRLLLLEGLFVAALGTLLGLVLAVGYARLMIYGLTTWWKGAIGTSFLILAVQPTSLVIGAAIALAVAIPGMWLGVRQMLKISPRDRLHGVMLLEETQAQNRRGRGWLYRTGLTCLTVALLLVLSVVMNWLPQTEAFGGFNWHIVGFFLGGFLALTGALLTFAAILRLPTQRGLSRQGLWAAAELGRRNIGRNRQRSNVTVILVSLATFVVVAVAAGRQKPTQMQPDFYSGNGGFSLVAESARPVLYDLTTTEGQQKLGLSGSETESLRALLDQAKVMSFRVRPGEDASCLNLYQTRLPTILGVPQEMIERGGFLFADTPGEHPWKLLDGTTNSQQIPVIGDMNTLQYSLHKAIGDTIELPPELQIEQSLEVVGSLGGSVFQGVLLMSEENFLKLFPDIAGYNYFLIEAPVDSLEPLTRQLESRLVALGFDVELIGRRLENFLAVQNTYLSTFQALGGFGLLLGTVGLGTVMLRNVLERRAELALMRAIGFQRRMLAVMVLAENAYLLLIGLGIGTSTALLAMLPNLLSRGADMPWQSGIGLLLGVFLTGMLASLVAVGEAVRTPVLKTLRSE